MKHIKDIFQDESYFNKWLSTNLHKLEPILGLNLDLVQKEKSVGPKKLDILAKDEKDNMIAIENQFGISDFKHLGQILTYSIGLKVKKIIWIAEEFHQVHLDVLKWLNNNKGDVLFNGISVVNSENNVNNDREKVIFTKPRIFHSIKIGDILDALNQDGKVEIDKTLKDLFDNYQKEYPKRRAVSNGLLSGSFQYYIWEKNKDVYMNYFKTNKKIPKN